jgi:putative acetyltransferase
VISNPQALSYDFDATRAVPMTKPMTSSSERIVVSKEDPHSDTAAKLIRELTANIARIYHDLGQDGSGSFTPDDVTVARSAFLVARLDGVPVGCGALRPLDLNVAEVKRMFVAPEARRKGVGRRVLAHLEQLANEFGYRSMRLETGVRQPEAIALYEAHGFYRIPAFGKYVGNPISICFEKLVVNC